MNTVLKTWLKRAVVFLVVAAMAITLFPFTGLRMVTKAADPAPQTDAPAFAKNLHDNGDGTYTLSLSVTGKQDESIIEHVNKANVILVIDTSSSMNNSAGDTYYTVPDIPGNPNTGGVNATYYRLNNGSYSQVYYWNGNWYTSQYGGNQFTGQFYSRSRFWAEYHALTDNGGIVDSLLSQNTTLNPDIIEIAIADFGGGGKTDLDFSGSSNTNAAAIKNVISGLTPTRGTNWEEGLMEAHSIYNTLSADEKANEKTYVVFLTDGQPTNHYYNTAVDTAHLSDEFDYAKDDARTLVDTDKAEFYGVFTWGEQQYLQCVQSLVGYAYTGSGSYNTGAQGKGDHVFNATSTAELINALKQIADHITNNVGYTDAGVHDGVTSMTSSSVKATAQGDVTGLKYYRSGGSYGTADIPNGNYGTEWTDAPHATVGEGGVINWELGDNFDLENGVTYTVTFVVWPKQASLDLVADLNNGIVSYDSLTDDQKSQIKVSGGKYFLKTNTDYPSVSYKTYTQEVDEQGRPKPGTRVESDPKTSEIDNPDPVSLAEEKLNALKIWEDSLDPSQRDDVGTSVTLYLKVDGHYYYYEEDGVTPKGVTLQKDKNWEESDYISIAPGIMVTESSPAYDPSAIQVTYNGVKYALIEEGHDYVFEESKSDKHFELTAYHHHPMIMGENADGSMHVVDVIFTYAADGKTITGIEAIKELSDSLSATNTLKGGINVQKKVVDEKGNEVTDVKDSFPVTIVLKNPNGSDYSYDYRIYYGTNNPKYNNPDPGTSADDIAKHRSGHIYGTGTIEGTIYLGDQIRVVNVDTGTLYYVIEPSVGKGYDLDSVTYTYSTLYGGTEAKDEITTTLGEDEETVYHAMQANSAATALVTNTYAFGDLEVTKTVKVLSGNATQAKAKEFEFTFKLYDRAPAETDTDDDQPAELTGLKYNYTKTAADGTKTSGVITEGDTFKLKDGEKLTINKLPVDSYYEVTETSVAGYATTPEGGVASGEIEKNENASAAFTNTYSATPTSATLEVEKELSGRTLKDEEFSFQLLDSTEKVLQTVKNKSGKATFEAIEYTAVGTYTYTIVEVKGELGGVTYDTLKVTATVEVTDNGEGALSAAVTYSTDKTFNNTYAATGTFTPEVTKALTGKTLEADQFTFELTGYGIASPQQKKNAADGKVTFNEITYTLDDVGKTISYTIKEVNGGSKIDGTTYDGMTVTINVTVADNGDGTLTVTPTYSSDTEFNNTYEATGTFTPEVTKVLTGKTLEKDQFTFELTGYGIASPQQKKNAADGKVTFDTISYTQDDVGKTISYTIKEVNGGQKIDGITYDDMEVTISVKVEDNGNGTLKVTPTYPSDTEFNNTYTVEPIKAQIPVQKNVSPDAGLNVPDIEGIFTFTLAAANEKNAEGVESPMPATTTVVCGPSGEIVKFPEISYNAAGEYHYAITESVTPGKEPGGVVLETSDPKYISVVVTDNGDGTLTAKVNGGTEDKPNPLEFTNPYHVEELPITIPVKKILSVPEGVTAPDIQGKFTFTIADYEEDDVKSPIPATPYLTNPDKNGGSMVFGDKDTTGEIIIRSPGVYTYTITESGSAPGVQNADPAVQKVTVTVTDAGNGKLVATYSPQGEIQFKNTYNVEPITATIPVEKILDVGEGLNAPNITEEFTFTLTAGSNNAAGNIPTPMPSNVEKTNPDEDGGDMVFGGDDDPITFTKPGTYQYTVTESGTVAGVSAVTPTSQSIEVVVDDSDGNGKMTVTVNGGKKLTFTNEYKVNETTAIIPVNKILEVPEGLTPNSIKEKYTFTLEAVSNTAAGGIANPLPTTVEKTNPDENGGKITFGGTDDPITFTKPGTYTYKITESGNVAGVKNDEEATKTFDIVVSDNGDGNLTAVVNNNQEIKFTNKYNVTPTTVQIPVQKTLNVPEGTDGPDIKEKYDIKLAADNEKNAEGLESPLPKTTSYKNPESKGGTVTFGSDDDPITFTKPGTYYYKVSEEGTVSGVTNDMAASGKTITVEVIDNGDGTLTAKASSTKDNPETFINVYSYGSITATPAVNKTLKYEKGLNVPDITEKYTFTLVADNEKNEEGVISPMPESGTQVKNPAPGGGTVSFGTIKFTKPGTYNYKVSEEGTVTGVSNDEEASGKSFKIIVTDTLEGKLDVTIDYGNNEGHVTFTNEYKVEPTTVSFPVKKVLVEDSTSDLTLLDITEKYTFTLEAGENTAEGNIPTPMPKATALKNPESKGGTVTFGSDDDPITFTKPGTYYYTVYEAGTVSEEFNVQNDPDATTGKSVIVTVVDDGEGNLTATASSTADAPLTFTNTRQQVSASVKKVWEDYDNKYGKRPESLKVDLLANGTIVEGKTVTLNQNNNWTATVQDLPKLDADGKEIKYTWKEETLPKGYELTGNTTQARITTLTNTSHMGDLIIDKTVEKFSYLPDAGEVTFTYHIVATKNGKTVYDDYEALSFNAEDPTFNHDQVKIEGKIPVGATVTVTEVNDGAGYKSSDGVTEVSGLEITDPTDTEAKTATASFKNTFGDEFPGGYGIVNHYTKDGKDWKRTEDPAVN